MSLFRVREFWSLELDQLIARSDGSASQGHQQQTGEVNGIGDDCGGYVADWGQFESTGRRRSVFVCGHLSGFICGAQVPEEKQLLCNAKNVNKHDTTATIGRIASPQDSGKEILFACQLNYPIIDLKCGHFTSATKQTIAVLSFDKLLVFQVKQHQVVDLITATTSASKVKIAGDESLLAYELEELYRIELLLNEVATLLLPLEASVGEYETHSHQESAVSTSNKLAHRISLLIRYANQFVFTVVDYKRLVGHFRCQQDDDEKESSADSKSTKEDEQQQSTSNVQSLAQCLGPMPVAYLADHLNSSSQSSLAIALSDQVVRCVLVEGLLKMAKQNVVKRVAKNLLFERQQQEKLIDASESDDADDTHGSVSASQLLMVNLDLDSVSIWEHEFPLNPLEMHSIRRSATQHCELMVISRYTIDLLSASGQHLWSQRFEEPLVCSRPYLLAPSEAPAAAAATLAGSSQPPQARLLTLLCSDNLASDKCNLNIFEEDRLVWSALLDSRPAQIWRTNELSRAGNVLATLDISAGRVAAHYLGTNPTNSGHDHDDELLLDTENFARGSASLSQLELLDAPIWGEEFNEFESMNENELNQEHDDQDNETNLLEISAKMEARNEWPNVSVDCQIKLKANEQIQLSSSRLSKTSSAGVLHNMLVTMEFDDLFQLKSTNHHALIVAPGVVQIKLGSYWPDRGEPLDLSGTFSVRNQQQFGLESMRQVDEQQLDPLSSTHDSRSSLALPRDLKVKLYVRFSDTRIGGVALQKYELQLPINIVGQLIHIDYTSGTNGQNLADVLGNLNPYKRDQLAYGLKATPQLDPSESPYYLCDLFARYPGSLIDLLDDIVESDLVCRGQNIESQGASKQVVVGGGGGGGGGQDSSDRRASVLENVNLLAQSLDCRLKFRAQRDRKSLAPSQLQSQSSEDQAAAQPLAMVSIAIKIPSGQLPPNNLELVDNKQGDGSVVWLHLLDLALANGEGDHSSKIAQQFIRLHMADWKVFPADCVANMISDKATEGTTPILISIESEDPLPVLFVQNQIVQRLATRFRLSGTKQWGHFYPIDERISDSIEIDINNLIGLSDNLIAISSNLHLFLLSVTSFRNNIFTRKYLELKDRLSQEYYKFYVATSASLSLCKQLASLPDGQRQQFNDLITLTKQYQLKLVSTLQELERMKSTQISYLKFPASSHLFVEQQTGSGLESHSPTRWPGKFCQLID